VTAAGIHTPCPRSGGAQGAGVSRAARPTATDGWPRKISENSSLLLGATWTGIHLHASERTSQHSPQCHSLGTPLSWSHRKSWGGVIWWSRLADASYVRVYGQPCPGASVYPTRNWPCDGVEPVGGNGRKMCGKRRKGVWRQREMERKWDGPETVEPGTGGLATHAGAAAT